MDSLLNLTFLAQNDSGAGGIIGCMVGIIYLAIIVGIIAGMWKMFTKAGQPGWACLVPIYNAYIWCKIVGRPGWWVLLLFIPIVSLVIFIIIALDTAKAFGKGVGFAIGIILLGFIFIPILGFGDAQYQGPVAA